jgi:hypothetical protein
MLNTDLDDPAPGQASFPEPDMAPGAAGGLSLPLPPAPPAILAGPEDARARMSARIGIGAGLAISVGLGLLAPASTAVGQMFNPRTPTAAVPTTILCLFFWGLLLGLNRFRRLRAIDALSAAPLLTAVIDGLHGRGVEALGGALQGAVVDHSPLLRRIRIAVEQWLIRPSLRNANLALEQQVMSDQAMTQRGYNLLRLFVWAAPVLGLIGTVVGISLAVGGFSSFLSTNVDDVSKIKSGLVGVTGGLSFAFMITLEGLLVSLVLMLLASTLQNNEGRLYARIDQGVSEFFLPELQRTAPEVDTARGPVTPDVWSEAMAAAAKRVMGVIDDVSRQLMADWRQGQNGYLSDLKAVSEAIGRLAAGVSQSVDQVTATMRAQAASASAEQARVSERLLEGVRDSLALSTRDMTRATADVSAGLRAVVDAVGELARITRQVLEAQAAFQAAMVDGANAGPANLLARLDGSLKDLKPVLVNLSRPFVLQAVPMAMGER